MQHHPNRPWHAVWHAITHTRFHGGSNRTIDQKHSPAVAVTLICALLLGMMPAAAMAESAPTQADSAPLFLPMISGGLGQPEEDPIDQELAKDFAEQTDDTPFIGFDEIPTDELQAALLAQAASELPKPAEVDSAAGMAGAAAGDMDADGVPNDADNCPHQPNPPRNGKQPNVCGRALVRLVDRLVFLHSRIFLPITGFDPGLKRTQDRARIHVLLHVRPNDNGVMLAPQQRATLQSLGVNILGYLPHNTFFVSLPRDLATVQQLVALEHVRGLSAIRPKDKVAPQVRVQGPQNGRNDDGTMSFEVDFFADVPQADIEAMLTQAGVPFEFLYEHTYRVTLKTWDDLRRLVIQDMVYFVGDLPDEVFDRTENAQALMNGQIVSNTLGFRGNNIVVSMTESNLAEPTTRTDMTGRVTLGNNPIFEGDDDIGGDSDHPQMVSGIMVSDGATFPERAGLLPEADLITYSTAGLTIRAQHFGVNEEAHDDFGAILSNNSWGPSNCSKIGEYRKRGKFFDRAVYDVGINIVYAAGNTRGPDGVFADKGCEVDLYSLPHPVAKNDISLGNWDINTGALNATSSAGPAADERLKPDIVAPGQGTDAVGWDDVNQIPETIQGGGTSAASPVASGVVGWIAESFLTQGLILDTIMPARYKAILVHTAKDVGPIGPDYKHGYGLIQADRALRIAEEWSQWGREGTLDDNTTQIVYPFDIDSEMAFYKATLVWDDEEGEHTSTMALKNDLDLILVSPSGIVYRPYDLPLPVGATTDDGSEPCLLPGCHDRLNNVEMVMAKSSTSDFLEQGAWQAVVNIHRLVSNEQKFSLVLTPPCPIEFDSSVTLTGNIECEGHPLQPTAVVIQTDGVNLNCDGNEIDGQQAGLFDFDGSYIGVRVLADDVVVRNCVIKRFDVGIQVGDRDISPDNASLRRNTLFTNGTVAIELVGTNHTARENDISQMVVSTGKGISVRGDDANVIDNEFHSARTGGDFNNTVGIIVHADSDNASITGNTFDGQWWVGIRLRSVNGEKPILSTLVDDNHFEGIETVPINLMGNVQISTVSNNFVSAYGSGSPGIKVESALTEDEISLAPKNNTLSTNTVIGFSNAAQLGIEIIGADNTQVLSNILSTVKMGITEENAMDTLISNNVINPVQPAPPYLTTIGIQATESLTLTNIINNDINFATLGIVVNKPQEDAIVSQNTMSVALIGVSLIGAEDARVTFNGVDAFLSGIAAFNSPAASISSNNIEMHGVGTGIAVGLGDETMVASNTIISPAKGILITSTQSVSVTNNSITEPTDTGIILGGDTGGLVQGNDIDDSTLGIHYKDGIDAQVITNTVSSLVGGVGIRLGTGATGCPINVDDILVQDNILTGGALGVEVLCDVGTHTLINN